MQWVVSLESTGRVGSAALDHDIRLLAAALRDAPAAVEERETGYGTTLLIDCDDPKEALEVGLRTLRAAERLVGIDGLPVVSAEVTAASEVDGAPVPPRRVPSDHLTLG